MSGTHIRGGLGPCSPHLAPKHSGVWGIPHPLSSGTPGVLHPTSQAPATPDTGADRVPTLMLGGATPGATARSPKGAGGTQRGCRWVGKPTRARSTQHTLPGDPYGAGNAARTYLVMVASLSPAGDAARAWWGSALPNTHRCPSSRSNPRGERADGEGQEKEKNPQTASPGAAKGAPAGLWAGGTQR